MTPSRAPLSAVALLLSATLARAEYRDIPITARYLYLPIASRAPARTVTMTVEGHPFLTTPFEAADGQPEWWTSIDVSPLKGKTLHLDCPDLPRNSAFLAHITQGDDKIHDAPDLYHEPGRPLVHFSASRGWLNDPNGLLFYQGTYHAFFQLDPGGWGDHIKFWGHATSTDLTHWTEHSAAIFPDELGHAYSGSGVVDFKNTSGLGDGKTPPFVFFYTAAGRPFTQVMAYSLDAGRTFVKYAKNPVIPNLHADNRDPRVLWHEPTQKWVMVVWVPVPTDPPSNRHRDAIQFLTSPNLRDWTPTSQSDGFFECPDLIAFPNGKWVLTSASGVYQVGTFDGTAFHPETKHLQSVQHGTYYAPQTFTNAPDGRVLQMGWMHADSPGMPFNQSLSPVQELKLIDTPEGPRLARSLAKEFDTLREPPMKLPDLKGTFPPGEIFLGDAPAEALDVTLDLELTKGKLDLTLRGERITWNADTSELFVSGRKSPMPLPPGRQSFRILLDRTTIELFTRNGQLYLPVNILPPPNKHALSLRLEGSPATLHDLTIHPLKSMWAK